MCNDSHSVYHYRCENKRLQRQQAGIETASDGHVYSPAKSVGAIRKKQAQLTYQARVAWEKKGGAEPVNPFVGKSDAEVMAMAGTYSSVPEARNPFVIKEMAPRSVKVLNRNSCLEVSAEGHANGHEIAVAQQQVRELDAAIAATVNSRNAVKKRLNRACSPDVRAGLAEELLNENRSLADLRGEREATSNLVFSLFRG